MVREKRPPETRRRTPRHRGSAPAARTSWDPLAAWYDGWVGEHGSEYHRKVALPAVIDLLDLRPGERVLDVGAGQGVLAPHVLRGGATYTGVDASPRLIEMAQTRHSEGGAFLVGDARRLEAVPGIVPASFDAAVFLLSLQDMDPLDAPLRGAAWALKESGRVVLLLTHPAFRVPRQSGWGWDEGRKLMYRRVDRYLTPLPVPMKVLPGRDTRATTRSFHRPLQDYVNGLSAQGLYVDHMTEIPATRVQAGREARAEASARSEIPLFLAIRARKLSAPL